MSVEKDILRVATSGNVDDGKSTLIGRLLYDNGSIPEDQLATLQRQSGSDQINLAYVTDGLKAEREEGITIDVAYRYFETSSRKFILADVPGHFEYTRNMITGASKADAVIVLVDSIAGITTQTLRHAMIATLLDVDHLCICINKMDACGYSMERFIELQESLINLLQWNDHTRLHFIPTSGLIGDNVVRESGNMEWYTGKTVLALLNSLKRIAKDQELRMQVQHVQDGYSFCKVISGTLDKETKQLQGAWQQAEVKELLMYGDHVSEAAAGDQITIRTDSTLQVGEILCSLNSLLKTSNKIEASICWLSEEGFQDKKFELRQGTFKTLARLNKLNRFIFPENAYSLSCNTIAEAEIVTDEQVRFDPYKKNKETGSFILIDPESNNTVAAGFIKE